VIFWSGSGSVLQSIGAEFWSGNGMEFQSGSRSKFWSIEAEMCSGNAESCRVRNRKKRGNRHGGLWFMTAQAKNNCLYLPFGYRFNKGLNIMTSVLKSSSRGRKKTTTELDQTTKNWTAVGGSGFLKMKNSSEPNR
jgi:hypothetical protein